MKYCIALEELPGGGIRGGDVPEGQLRQYSTREFEEWETLTEVREVVTGDKDSPFCNEEFVWYMGKEVASETAPLKLLWKKGKDVGVSRLANNGNRQIVLKVWPGDLPIDFERNEETEAISILEKISVPKIKIVVIKESDETEFVVDVNPDTLSVDSLKKVVIRRLGAGALGLREESVLFFDPRCRAGVELNDNRLAALCREASSVLMCQKALLKLRVVLRKSLFSSHKFDVEIHDLDTLEDLRRAICARAAEETPVKDLDPDTIRLKIRGTTIDTNYEKWYYRKQGRPLGDCWMRFFELKGGDKIDVKAGTPALASPDAN